MTRVSETPPKKPPSQWDPYIKAYNKNNFEKALKTKEAMIPKIIHQIWIGSELPERFKPLIESWQKNHPNWEYHLWDDEAVKEHQFISDKMRELFEKATNYGMKADILRVDLLYQYGGVYVDIDFRSLRPLDPLHHNHFCKFYAACLGQSGVVANGLIGSIPKHPLLTHLIMHFKKIKTPQLLSDDEIQQATGPNALTKTIHHFITFSNHNICIYPTNFFYPFPIEMRHNYWDQTISLESETSYLHPYTFAVHYWAASWTKEIIEKKTFK